MKKFISIILIFCICITSINFYVEPVFAKTALEEANDKKAEIEKELAAAEQKLKSYQDILNNSADDNAKLDAQLKIEEAEKEVLTAQLQDIYNQGEAIKAALEDAESDYQKAEEAFYANARMMYIYSKQSTLEILAGSKSISDFFKRVKFVLFLSEEDDKLMADLESSKQDYEYKKQYYDENYDLINQAVEDKNLSLKNITLSKEELEAKIQKAKSLINKTENDQDSLKEDLSAVQAQIKKLNEIQKNEAKKTETKNTGGTSNTNSNGNSGNNSNNGKYTGGKMLWPVPASNRISSDFGNRVDPINGKIAFHSGIDIPAPKGSAILAAADGKVIFSGVNGGYGNGIKIDNGSGLVTMYGHCSELVAKLGDNVKRGDLIAKVGTTGRSTGNHCHFEVQKDKISVSPWPYLNG